MRFRPERRTPEHRPQRVRAHPRGWRPNRSNLARPAAATTFRSVPAEQPRRTSAMVRTCRGCPVLPRCLNMPRYPARTAADGTPLATRAQAHTQLENFGKVPILLGKFLTFCAPAGTFRSRTREFGKVPILLRKFLLHCKSAESFRFSRVTKCAEMSRRVPTVPTLRTIHHRLPLRVVNGHT